MDVVNRHAAAAAATARVRRVSGPVVKATGLAKASMFELAEVGPDRIPAEIVAIDEDTVTLQAYEYTGGLRAGDAVRSTGRPLSALLGPGLLGQVFDGLLRPLSSAPRWLTPVRQAFGGGPVWTFSPQVSVGQRVEPGTSLGSVPVRGGPAHRALVPPGVAGVVTRVAHEGPVDDDAVIAEVDGRAIGLWELWPVRRPRPFRERDHRVVPLHTGQRVLDLLFPIGRGSSACVPGGFGTGKTLLLQQIAKWCDADVIVYVGCGERGNEMADALDELSELTDPRTGGRLIDRTVILANTSNMPMMAREASIYTAITVGEYFRDMGHDAVVIADSTSRWAEARREFASRTGALPAEEGYPADLASSLAAFYERAGRVRTLNGDAASVTIVGAVSPPGGDTAEPVTTATARFVETVWSLDRDLAYSRHYPAVSWDTSFARQAAAAGVWHADVGDPDWPRRRARAAMLLSDADRLTALAEIIGASSLPGHERMVMLAGRLLREGVLMQNALSANDSTCTAEKGAALLQAVLDVTDSCLRLVEHGIPAAVVEEFDFGPLLRLRDDVGPADAATVASRSRAILRDLEKLA